MVKLSGVVITYNEEENIGRCLDSLSAVADEIVVVDSYSDDATKKICLDKKARFIENRFAGHIQQKNFALSRSNFDHILSLDADEYLSDQLIDSILEAKSQWSSEAYSMNRLSSYCGKWVKHGDWYPDKKIRLWNKNIGSWGGQNPHDKVVLKEGYTPVHLPGDILHEAYVDSFEALDKIQIYSEIYAKENAGIKSTSVIGLLLRSQFAFFRSYILRRGIADGYAGFMVAMSEFNHTLYKYAKLYEANQRAQKK